MEPETITPTIKTRADLVQVMSRLGDASAKLAAEQAKLNARIAKARAAHEAKTASLREDVNEMTEAVEAYALEHEAELVDEGSRTATLPTGRIKYRSTPPRLALPEGASEADVCEVLERQGHYHLVQRAPKLKRRDLMKRDDLSTLIPGARIERRTVVSIQAGA